VARAVPGQCAVGAPILACLHAQLWSARVDAACLLSRAHGVDSCPTAQGHGRCRAPASVPHSLHLYVLTLILHQHFLEQHSGRMTTFEESSGMMTRTGCTMTSTRLPAQLGPQAVHG